MTRFTQSCFARHPTGVPRPRSLRRGRAKHTSHSPTAGRLFPSQPVPAWNCSTHQSQWDGPLLGRFGQAVLVWLAPSDGTSSPDTKVPGFPCHGVPTRATACQKCHQKITQFRAVSHLVPSLSSPPARSATVRNQRLQDTLRPSSPPTFRLPQSPIPTPKALLWPWHSRGTRVPSCPQPQPVESKYLVSSVPLSVDPEPVRARGTRVPNAMRANSRSRQPRQARRGITIVELVAALVLLGVAYSLTVSMLASVALQRRSAEQQQVALQHAANLLERTAARSWADLPTGRLSTPDPPANLTAVLPELDQRVEVTETKQDENAKRVTVTLSWRNRAGQIVAPVQLTTWIYPGGGSP